MPALQSGSRYRPTAALRHVAVDPSPPRRAARAAGRHGDHLGSGVDGRDRARDRRPEATGAPRADHADPAEAEALTAALAPGSITPMTGTSSSTRSRSSATADNGVAGHHEHLEPMAREGARAAAGVPE